jgi:hypothetical protein
VFFYLLHTCFRHIADKCLISLKIEPMKRYYVPPSKPNNNFLGSFSNNEDAAFVLAFLEIFKNVFKMSFNLILGLPQDFFFTLDLLTMRSVKDICF